MPGEANVIQAGINMLKDQLKNATDPVEIEKLKKAIKEKEELLKEITGR